MFTLYETQLRHAFYYQKLLESVAESYLESRAAAKGALEMLELEWANIEAGHRWASEKSTGETGAALRAAYAASAAIVREWATPPKELARWAKEGLFAARQLDDREAVGRHLSNLGHACDQMGQFRRALTCHKLALSISREFDNRHTEAEDLFGTGMALLNLGGAREAAGLFKQSLNILRELGDRFIEASALSNLGLAYESLGQTRRAIGCHERVLTLTREFEDRRGEAQALNHLRERLGYSAQGPGGFEPQKPDLSAYTHYLGNFGPGRPGGTSVKPFDDGTSAAAPTAAGVSALLLSAFPQLTPAQIKNTILASADRLNTPGWNPETGFGIVNGAAAFNMLR
jgi:tetratricopeptide (TPR) repeat protein